MDAWQLHDGRLSVHAPTRSVRIRVIKHVAEEYVHLLSASREIEKHPTSS